MESNTRPRNWRPAISTHWLRILPVLALAALYAACATPQKGSVAKRCEPPKTQQGDQGPDQSKAACTYIQLTPLSSVWTDFANPDQNYSNLYTRVLINSLHTRDYGSTGGKPDNNPTQGSEQLYEYRDRGWFLRTFWGTHYALNLTAYISVGNFQATVPLVTIDHTSNHSDGEKFVRIVAHTIQNFPLILLRGDGSNTMATVHFVVKATDTTQSSAAAAAIETAQGIATVLAPESSVLTTLSSPATKDKATALDKAINAVLSRQLDEEQWLDNDARRWHGGARVTFLIPPSTDESNWSDSANFGEVGSWTVKFESPRPSVFSDIQICLPPSKQVPDPSAPYCRATVAAAVRAAQEEAASRPEQVLNFSLISGTQTLGIVSAYLKQQSWWDQSVKTFNGLKDNEEPKKDTVAEFCRSIKQTIVGVGLNTIDGGIVVGAVRDRISSLSQTVVTAMKTNPDCQPATIAQP